MNGFRGVVKFVAWIVVLIAFCNSSNGQAIKTDPATIHFGQGVTYSIDPPFTDPVQSYL
jgi:hypothetical protein